MNTRTYTGWAALVGAVLLWGIVAYSIQSVEQQKNNYTDLVSNAQRSELQETSSTQLQGLMSETEGERATLQATLPADIPQVVDAIDAAGRLAGVNIQISNAQSENVTGAESSGISALAFVIQSQGSFAQLSRLIVLLSSLPMPTYIEHIDLTRSATSAWNLTARTRILTVSSTTQ